MRDAEGAIVWLHVWLGFFLRFALFAMSAHRMRCNEAGTEKSVLKTASADMATGGTGDVPDFAERTARDVSSEEANGVGSAK